MRELDAESRFGEEDSGIWNKVLPQAAQNLFGQTQDQWVRPQPSGGVCRTPRTTPYSREGKEASMVWPCDPPQHPVKDHPAGNHQRRKSQRQTEKELKGGRTSKGGPGLTCQKSWRWWKTGRGGGDCLKPSCSPYDLSGQEAVSEWVRHPNGPASWPNTDQLHRLTWFFMPVTKSASPAHVDMSAAPSASSATDSEVS